MQIKSPFIYHRFKLSSYYNYGAKILSWEKEYEKFPLF